jgi:hypothetical protein
LAFWAVFATGLVVKLLAPNLEISNRTFVMPEVLTADSRDIRPMEIISRERRMQVTAAVLTATGAIGLAVLYRQALFGKRRRPETAETG